MSNIVETLIRITPDNHIEVKSLFDDDTAIIKNVSYDDLVSCVMSSIKQKEDVVADVTPILPNNEALGIKTIKYVSYSDGKEIIYMIKKAHRCDITYHTTVFHDVGIPNLIFAITVNNGQFRRASTLALESADIRGNTPLYYYPFSNVGCTGSICFGTNHMVDFSFKEISHLQSLPSMFLAMPNNDDQYGNNNSNLPYRKLLEQLEGHDFPLEYLKLTSMTFNSWTENIGGI